MTAATENGAAVNPTEGETPAKLEETKTEGGSVKEAEKTEAEEKTEAGKTEEVPKAEDKTESDVKINIQEETKEEAKEEKGEVIVTDGVEVDPGLAAKIMKQLEYYFGDRNLVKDRFLLREVTLDEGWIPLNTMLNFKRLATMCSDKAKIAKSVELSNSELVVLHESKSKIRRNPNKPLPVLSEDTTAAHNLKTIYIKGFPLDLTLDAAEEFITPHGKTVFVKLRKDNMGQFKSSVFIEFAEQEDCDKFLALENVKYGESTEPLLIMSRNAYFKSKNVNQRNEKNEKREAQLGHVQPTQQQRIPDVLTYEKGMVIKVSGLEAKETSREDIKDLFEGHGLKWVTYNKGDVEAFIRFDNDAAAVLEKVKVDGKFMLSQMELEAEVIEGEDEEEYHKTALQEKNDFFNRQRKRKNDQSGRGRGRGRGNKRHKRY